MREDGLAYPGFFAPVQLSCDRSVTNQSAILSSHHWPSDGRAIADVKFYPSKWPRPIGNLSHVRNIHEAALSHTDAQSHCRCSARMLDRKGLEPQMVDDDRPAHRHRASISNGKSGNQCPSVARGIDRARCPLSQPSRMVGMRMCEDDGRRQQGIDPMQPVPPAIDHDTSSAMLHEQRAMPMVPRRADGATGGTPASPAPLGSARLSTM